MAQGIRNKSVWYGRIGIFPAIHNILSSVKMVFIMPKKFFLKNLNGTIKNIYIPLYVGISKVLQVLYFA